MSLAHEGTVLVTGAAGFIGFHLADRLLRHGCRVVGVDSLNDYYDPRLKRACLARLTGRPGFAFEQLDLADRPGIEAVRPTAVVHLAAQAGVCYSLQNSNAYVDASLVDFMNLLEGCRQHAVRHLVYASTSSVYGANTQMPFSVHDNVDHRVRLYAATKKANELMAHTYSHLYGLPTTGLRFFTVYGPWGRLDMALFIFTKAMLEGRPIRISNEGRMQRDFTYVDDIVEGVRWVVDGLPEPDPAWSGDHPDPGNSRAPYRIYNIGNHQPVELLRMIETPERALGVTATKELLPMQPGDVPATFADITDLETATGFAPTTPLEAGVERFVRWYRDEWLPITTIGTRGVSGLFHRGQIQCGASIYSQNSCEEKKTKDCTIGANVSSLLNDRSRIIHLDISRIIRRCSDSRWISDRTSLCRHIAKYYCAGSNYGVTAYAYIADNNCIGKYCDVRSYPWISISSNRGRSQSDMLIYRDIFGNSDALPNYNTNCMRKIKSASYACPWANVASRNYTRCQVYQPAYYDSYRTQLNHCRTYPMEKHHVETERGKRYKIFCPT